VIIATVNSHFVNARLIPNTYLTIVLSLTDDDLEMLEDIIYSYEPWTEVFDHQPMNIHQMAEGY
jgi:hypothetical protein